VRGAYLIRLGLNGDQQGAGSARNQLLIGQHGWELVVELVEGGLERAQVGRAQHD